MVTNTELTKKLISQKELIKALGISRSTMYRYIKIYNLPYTKFGESSMFNIDDIDYILKKNTVNKPAEVE